MRKTKRSTAQELQELYDKGKKAGIIASDPELQVMFQPLIESGKIRDADFTAKKEEFKSRWLMTPAASGSQPRLDLNWLISHPEKEMDGAAESLLREYSPVGRAAVKEMAREIKRRRIDDYRAKQQKLDAAAKSGNIGAMDVFNQVREGIAKLPQLLSGQSMEEAQPYGFVPPYTMENVNATSGFRGGIARTIANQANPEGVALGGLLGPASKLLGNKAMLGIGGAMMAPSIPSAYDTYKGGDTGGALGELFGNIVVPGGLMAKAALGSRSARPMRKERPIAATPRQPSPRDAALDPFLGEPSKKPDMFFEDMQPRRKGGVIAPVGGPVEGQYPALPAPSEGKLTRGGRRVSEAGPPIPLEGMGERPLIEGIRTNPADYDAPRQRAGKSKKELEAERAALAKGEGSPDFSRETGMEATRSRMRGLDLRDAEPPIPEDTIYGLEAPPRTAEPAREAFAPELGPPVKATTETPAATTAKPAPEKPAPAKEMRPPVPAAKPRQTAVTTKEATAPVRVKEAKESPIPANPVKLPEHLQEAPKAEGVSLLSEESPRPKYEPGVREFIRDKDNNIWRVAEDPENPNRYLLTNRHGRVDKIAKGYLEKRVADEGSREDNGQYAWTKKPKDWNPPPPKATEPPIAATAPKEAPVAAAAPPKPAPVAAEAKKPTVVAYTPRGDSVTTVMVDWHDGKGMKAAEIHRSDSGGGKKTYVLILKKGSGSSVQFNSLSEAKTAAERALVNGWTTRELLDDITSERGSVPAPKKKEGVAPPEPGMRNNDSTANPHAASYFKKGGWKLHLTVKPENYGVVDQWIGKNFRGMYKLLAGGDPGEKDFTIYVGDKQESLSLAARLKTELGDALEKNNSGRSDTLFNDKVAARFDVKSTQFGRKHQLAYYGENGIPRNRNDVLLSMQRDASRRKGESYDPNIDKWLASGDRETHRILTEEFGEYYTGKGVVDEGEGLYARSPEIAAKLEKNKADVEAEMKARGEDDSIQESADPEVDVDAPDPPVKKKPPRRGATPPDPLTNLQSAAIKGIDKATAAAEAAKKKASESKIAKDAMKLGAGVEKKLSNAMEKYLGNVEKPTGKADALSANDKIRVVGRNSEGKMRVWTDYADEIARKTGHTKASTGRATINNPILSAVKAIQGTRSYENVNPYREGTPEHKLLSILREEMVKFRAARKIQVDKGRSENERRLNEAYGDPNNNTFEGLLQAGSDALRGKLTTEVAPMKDRFSKGELDSLAVTIKNTKNLYGHEKKKAFAALNDLLEGKKPPTVYEGLLLESAFGKPMGQMIRDSYQNPILSRIGNWMAFYRTAKYGFDIGSAVFNQAAIQTAAHPVRAARAMRKMALAYFSRDAHKRFEADLAKSKYGAMSKDFGLGLVKTNEEGAGLTNQEEIFASTIWDQWAGERIFSRSELASLARKGDEIGVIGGVASSGKRFAAEGLMASERSYVTFLNQMRLGLWEQHVASLVKKGYSPENHPEVFQDLANWINDSTGRADLTGNIGRKFIDLRPNSALLSAAFTAPRFYASRIKVMNPARYGYMYAHSPEVAKLAVADMGKFIAVAALAGIVAEQAGADVEWDMRSGRFLKAKIGNTDNDLSGGIGSYVAFAAQTISNSRKTRAGEIVNFGEEGPFRESRLSTLSRFARGKLAPLPSTLVTALDQKDMRGKNFDAKWDMPRELAPLIGGDFVDYLTNGWLRGKMTGEKTNLNSGWEALFSLPINWLGSRSSLQSPQ